MALRFLKTFLRTVQADDKDQKPVIELTKTFDNFDKGNKSKCEIAGLAALKGAQLVLCGMECIDLMFNAIKIVSN